MLFFLVFATHQSRSSLPARSSFLPRSHSSLFFSEDCALFSSTALSQPLAYQTLPHSFHHDGGCTPYRHRRRDERTPTATPLESAFLPRAKPRGTNCDDCNSFRIRFYENCRVALVPLTKISYKSCIELFLTEVFQEPPMATVVPSRVAPLENRLPQAESGTKMQPISSPWRFPCAG